MTETMTENVVTAESLKSFQKELNWGRIDTNRVTLSDDIQSGLRMTIHRNGPISFQVVCRIGDERPHFKIGELSTMTIERARTIASKLRAIAETGVDPFEQMREQFIASL